MSDKIEIQMDEDRYVTIWHEFLTLLRLWVDENGQIHIAVPHFDDIDWHETLAIPPPTTRKIELHALVRKQEEHMALPRLVSSRIEDEHVFAPKKKEREGGSGGSRNDEHSVRDEFANTVLNAILDSMLLYPNADQTRTISESHRIAKDFNIKVGSVAAIRANLTRGSYGNPETVLATRASFLRRNAPLAQAQVDRR